MDRLACLGKLEVGGSSIFFGVVMKKIGRKGLDSMKSPKLFGFWMFFGVVGMGEIGVGEPLHFVAQLSWVIYQDRGS